MFLIYVVALDVAKGMARLHEGVIYGEEQKQIIHRDLAARNVNQTFSILIKQVLLERNPDGTIHRARVR